MNRVRNNQMSQTIRFVHLRPKHVSAEKDLQRNVSLPKLPRAHVQYSFQCPVCPFQSQKMETFQFCFWGKNLRCFNRVSILLCQHQHLSKMLTRLCDVGQYFLSFINIDERNMNFAHRCVFSHACDFCTDRKACL